jgi:hypothetical protein
MSQDLLFGEIDCYVFEIFLENFSAHDPGGVKKVGEFQLRTVFFNAEVLMKPGRLKFFFIAFLGIQGQWIQTLKLRLV